MKSLRPISFLACVLLLVGLACGALGAGETPASVVADPSTNTPLPATTSTQIPPTEAPSSTPAPTRTPVLQFFRQNFDEDPQWHYFLTFGDEAKADVSFSDGLMTFDLSDTDIYAYYMYEEFTYRDVRIDIRAENRGRNNNNVSLVCRQSDDGWYEFSTEGGGVWYLYAARLRADGLPQYTIVANGGALALKQGKEVNEYTMICQGNEIRLRINDVEIRNIVENEYAFREGYVGFNISSLNVVPIVVEVDWFEISEP